MGSLFLRRRGRLRLRARHRYALATILAALAAPAVALAVAQTALAGPVTAPVAGLLPSAVPSVCVGGVVLCGGPVVTQPTPCIAGTVLCGPLPLPSNPVIGTSAPATQSPGQRRPTPTPTATTTATAGIPSAGGGVGGGSVVVSAPLPAPPGVGLVALPAGRIDTGLAPDSVATVLSLSMRDGLGAGVYHVWPWLLAAQLVLLTLIAAVLWTRQGNQAAADRRG